ncbi:hypothetical protein A9G24_04985 [Gilliamella sp. App6-5]|uniref:hypothetical protein n=1 Tax=Gilliamella sp. App6-5 TaxID=3120232 RepID=UPI00080E052A|nr:hypothetical protein [Gilliamella apicola]OCG16186.1 hypothetical protein A9G24_04985 [Gilliamella apicola]
MRNLLFIEIILFSFYCYGQEFKIIENYEGKSVLNTINISKLEKDCEKSNDFWHFTNAEREKILERCPINRIASYFDNLYEIINNKIVIYDVNELKLTINKKLYNKTVNNKISPVKELNLSLFHKGKLKDKIILANSSYDVEGYYWLSNQYYYISPSKDVYLLLVKDIDTSVKPIFWKHYQIDKKDLQFQLKELLIDEGYKYQIIYPYKFEILEGALEKSKYDIDKLKTCYREQFSTNCSIDSYRYYHNLLSQKVISLKDKKTNFNESIDKIDKQINEICLLIPAPNYYYETEEFTYNITKCLTEQLNKKIEKLAQTLLE